MIEVEHVSKYWDDGVETLKDINLSIEDGDMYALVGRSGAGKSTLLRCINGLTSYSSGSVKVNGEEIKDLSNKRVRELRREIGMVFQHFSLLERATVFKNVALPMECWGYPEKEIDQKVSELLEFVELSDKKDARPRNLSGGQKQRVAIARALTMNPKILLCDEATSALDPKTTNAILDFLMKINRETGITIVIVTHQMEVVRKACQKACILEHGVIADMGDVLDIFFRRPASLLRLLGEEHCMLPQEGVNIRVAFNVNSIEGNSFFSAFSREVGFMPDIVDGGVQDFRNNSIGIFTVNTSEDARQVTEQYFEAHALKWNELELSMSGNFKEEGEE